MVAHIFSFRPKPLGKRFPGHVDVAPRLQVVRTAEPETRKAGVRVGSVDELVTKLKEVGAI